MSSYLRTHQIPGNINRHNQIRIRTRREPKHERYGHEPRHTINTWFHYKHSTRGSAKVYRILLPPREYPPRSYQNLEYFNTARFPEATKIFGMLVPREKRSLSKKILRYKKRETTMQETFTKICGKRPSYRGQGCA